MRMRIPDLLPAELDCGNRFLGDWYYAIISAVEY